MKGRIYRSFTDEELKIKMLPNKINYLKVFYWKYPIIYIAAIVFQVLICVQLFVTPWTTAHQVSLSFTSPRVCSNSCPLSWWCHPTISSSVVPFFSCLQFSPSSGSFLMSGLFAIRWQKSWSFSFSISPSNECLGLISFRTDWFDIFAV